ncbi:MAG: hypothetical protein ACE5GD_01460 [Candidatus Geothermarchaeales archaeon]
MNGERLTDFIKDFARHRGAEMVGVSPVERLKNAPEGHGPSDIHGGARSVISIALSIPRGVIHANSLAQSRGNRFYQYIYLTHGYRAMNNRLDQIAFETTSQLEGMGYVSTPIPASAPSSGKHLRGVFSHRHAAVAAGLGEFGWNALFMAPGRGPWVRLVTVITEADLAPDPMYQGEKLCDFPDCRVCVAVCPMEAIPEEEDVEVEIGGRVFRYASLNKWRCRMAVTLAPPRLRWEEDRDLEIPVNPSPDDFLEVLKKSSRWSRFDSIGSMCGRCLVECPLGKRKA